MLENGKEESSGAGDERGERRRWRVETTDETVERRQEPLIFLLFDLFFIKFIFSPLRDLNLSFDPVGRRYES